MGLTQQALADLAGFSLSAVGNWESQQNMPTPSKLRTLANKLGVSIDYLLGHVDFPGPRGAGPGGSSIRAVPIVSWAQAGDLVSYEALDESWHEYTPTTCKDENSFAVTIAGDSMEPKYSAGDIAVLMPTVEPRNGCLVVAKLKNEGVFFKLFHQGADRGYRLSSFNSAYPVMETRKSDFVWIYPVYQITKNVWR
jgi:SOS-response transcriptional repressor LexA